MSDKLKAEILEAEAEPMELPQETALVPQRNEQLTTDQMDAVTQIANRMDSYSKAMDTILNAIIKRAETGDWVCHDKESTPLEERKANIGAAAAERIAAFLGIQESNWTKGTKEWSDDEKHFTWIYEADFTFGRRTIHAIGKAGTRDKFFGFESGQWKALEDVQEDHIRTAAFRACRKEGVRQALGLRSIPLLKLKALGYDIAKIKLAGFKDSGKALSADEKKTDASGFISRKVKLKSVKMTEGKTKENKPWTRWDVADVDNVYYSFFANADSKRAIILSDAQASGEIVELLVVLKTYNNQEKYEIVKVNGSVDA